jgi:hypothetical protein
VIQIIDRGQHEAKGGQPTNVLVDMPAGTPTQGFCPSKDGKMATLGAPFVVALPQAHARKLDLLPRRREPTELLGVPSSS